MIYMVFESPFSPKCENQNPCMFANLAGIISIRVSNPRFSDMGNAMDTLF